MSAIQKEQIYVQLRQYHLDELPEKLSNSSMNDLLKDFRVLEDDAIAMLLGLVNGKTEYVDLMPKLKEFEDTAKPQLKGDKGEDAERKHFISKIDQLKEIIALAQKASFTIRPPRKTRESTRLVVTKVTKS